ncbi:TolA-binding protein [Catenulispora sp. EB89]|uniref:hypothetical protein n=1 Tax=Catenulispora sp. EB89 TaxID=3156257 RepID=UPI00351979EB
MTEEPRDGIGEGPQPPQTDQTLHIDQPAHIGQTPQADQPTPTPSRPTAYIPPHFLGSPPAQPAESLPPAPPVAPMPGMPGMPGMPIPMPVAPPPLPPLGPGDRWRAAAAALLNLSGLGLGHVLIRRWRGALACWLATGLLLLIALPAKPNGVPVAVVVIYLLFLLLAAARAAVLSRRRTLIWPASPQLAFGLAIVLLVVPICGTILYDNARQEAVQRMLLSRLAQADATIATAETQSSSTAEPEYLTALGTYQDLLDHHRTSRAAKQVPSRLAAFYQHVSAPYSNHDYCGAIEPLTFLRSLPDATISTSDLGPLAASPDDPLATSLYECGVSALGANADPTAAQDLNLLLSTFPSSAQAGKVEPAVAAAIGGAASGLTGSDPCSATATLTGLGTQVKALTSNAGAVSDALKKDVATDGGDIESGSYDCAVSDYKNGKFPDAQSAMDTFVSTYPDDPNKALAQKFSIAAQIAQQDADAGKVVPTLTSGGSVSITIANDSPDPMQILYTGPATGTINIDACSSCKAYGSDTEGQQNACSDTSIDYPKTSFTLPPGTTYFLQKSTGTSVRSYSHSEQYDADSTYAVCAFETSIFGNLGL